MRYKSYLILVGGLIAALGCADLALGQKNHAGRRRKDPFAAFKKAAEREFNFLEADYGFRKAPAKIQTIKWAGITSCVISYRNATTEVNLHYDLNAALWVEVSRLEQERPGVLVPGEGYNVEYLIKACCPGEAVGRKHGPYSDEDVGGLLNAYARVLREHGRGVLAGDFDIFPRLRSIVDDEVRGRPSLDAQAPDKQP